MGRMRVHGADGKRLNTDRFGYYRTIFLRGADSIGDR